MPKSINAKNPGFIAKKLGALVKSALKPNYAMLDYDRLDDRYPPYVNQIIEMLQKADRSQDRLEEIMTDRQYNGQFRNDHGTFKVEKGTQNAHLNGHPQDKSLNFLKIEKIEDPPIPDSSPKEAKKAVVYLGGNGSFSSTYGDPFSGPLYESHKKLEAKLGSKVTVFTQDYRGRGFNKDIPDRDTYGTHSIEQDAMDQAALIKNLVKQGYEPEDILMECHSIGGNVGLWAKYLLCQEDPKYNKLKIYCDRTYGAVNNYVPLMNLVVNENSDTMQLLKTNGTLCQENSWETAAKSNAIVVQAENDGVIKDSIQMDKMYEKFNKKRGGSSNKNKGFLRECKPFLDIKSHDLPLTYISTGIPGITHYDLQAALFTQKPVEMVDKETVKKNYLEILNKLGNDTIKAYGNTKEGKARQDLIAKLMQLVRNDKWDKINQLNTNTRMGNIFNKSPLNQKGALRNIYEDICQFGKNLTANYHPELNEFNRSLILKNIDLKTILFKQSSFDNIKSELEKCQVEKYCKTDVVSFMAEHLYEIFHQQKMYHLENNINKSHPDMCLELISYLKQLIETESWPNRKHHFDDKKIMINGNEVSVPKEIAQIYKCISLDHPVKAVESIGYMGLQQKDKGFSIFNSKKTQAKALRKMFTAETSNDHTYHSVARMTSKN